MPEYSLWQVIMLYLRVVIAYWWALLPGLVMPLIDALQFHRAEEKKIKIPPWLRLTVMLGALVIAQFLAYRNSIQNLTTVIEEKRQQSITVNSLRNDTASQAQQIASLKHQIEDLERTGPRIVTRTLPAPRPEQRCWLSNYFGMPNSTIKGAVTASTAIIHCNHKVDAPYVVQVQFDRDFLPGAGIPLDAGVIMSGGTKRGRIYIEQVSSPALLSDQVFVVTVYGETDQYPRALKASVESMK